MSVARNKIIIIILFIIHTYNMYLEVSNKRQVIKDCHKLMSALIMFSPIKWAEI